ncbi:DUF559 domain-containing protein [Microbacterium sp. NEAU-LLC]|uniref:DUF559 domain-containing protein n=1 Tax=Microbacterium helvum TaxID=2773713 RepID=A0ABR8NL98_9MICO|nr:DUF559 domain-containing protein [Microbacterium helvum]MBD3940708.1 DUF559 domain-containing protein [Microbacterium helvum]
MTTADRVDDDDFDAFTLQRERILTGVAHWSLNMASSEYFSHVTAAVIWGLPLPGWLLLKGVEPHVSCPGRATRMAGAVGHQIRDDMVTVVDHPDLGVRVTDPATTWAMLAGVLTNLYDVVAIADAVVRTPRIPGPRGRVERPPWGSVADLTAAVQAGRRVGADRLREALPLVRAGATSRPETWTRLVLRDAGLPEPELDVDIYDTKGEFVGCVDLVYRGARIAIEYEGDQHRTDRAQWQRDLEKHERLADLGWRVVRVPSEQVFVSPEILVARVRKLLRVA